MSRILVIGGYGAFGARVCERLAREPDLEVIVAGRREDAAAAYAAELSRTAKAKISLAVLDAQNSQRTDIRTLAAAVLINASGPFQAQSYGLAHAASAPAATTSTSRMRARSSPASLSSIKKRAPRV